MISPHNNTQFLEGLTCLVLMQCLVNAFYKCHLLSMYQCIPCVLSMNKSLHQSRAKSLSCVLIVHSCNKNSKHDTLHSIVQVESKSCLEIFYWQIYQLECSYIVFTKKLNPKLLDFVIGRKIS